MPGINEHTGAEISEAKGLDRSAIPYLENQASNLVDALENEGIRDETIVILTSDHGEALAYGTVTTTITCTYWRSGYLSI